MAEEGILKEFDPLTGSTEKTTAQANRRNNSELVTSNAGPATISNSNILDVFDPLAQEKSAKRQDLGQLPSISETSLHSVTSSSQSSTNHEHPSTVNHFNLTNKLERTQLGILAPKPVKDKQPVLTGASDQMKSDQIGAEIRQIDTVLKALNMGQFDLSSLGVGPTAQSVQISKFDQAKQAEAMASANHSTGLHLIGQLGSGDSGSSSESEDSSSDSSDDSLDLTRELREVNDSGSDGELISTRGKKPDSQGFPMSKGEVDYRTLPLPERCDIPFPEGGGTLMPIGRVSHVAEKLLVIHALPGTPPFDEGTVLWSKEKKSIARIFETFGPVKSPVYSVLVESDDHASSLGLTPGVLVYVVPSNMELTRYIFTQQLMKQKGSDASWKDDHEVPAQFQDYSDDESEQAANKGKRQGGKRGRQKSASQSFQPVPHNPGSNPLNVHHGAYPLNTAAVPGYMGRPPAHWGYGHQSGPSMHLSAHPSYPNMHYQTPPPPPH